LRLKELIETSLILKKRGHVLRLNTNGHGSLINKTDLPSKLVGIIDKVSVSLNAHDAETYVKICRPDRGQQAYEAMLNFIKGCKANGITVEASVVNLPEISIDECRKLASQLGATFRIRKYVPARD
jgi:TatD family-associated radical SAM protein